MPRCPNCSYKLVLLSHRRKYKCAKCSRLYLQKSIELKEFQSWNKLQRELDLNNLKLEIQQRKRSKLTLEAKIQRIKERAGLYRLKNIEKMRAKDRKRYAKNKDIINAKRRQRWKENSSLKANRKARRHRISELTRLHSRIDFWKQKQKVLADVHFNNKLYRAYTEEIKHSVPTFLLCEQL